MLRGLRASVSSLSPQSLDGLTRPPCFTIMPFSVRESDLDRYAGDEGHWSEVYQGLIIPAVEMAGLTCHRP